tara:strand:+ start:846 stop:1460 length:615 start_codon:yes stop_codon:yes gene_type:complete
MSLAIYAAPFENNNNKNYKLIDNDENIIEKKKSAKNRTQKKRRNLDEKIDNDVLNTIQQIHNSIDNNDDDDDNNNFVPPPPAISAGSERVDMRNELQEEQEEDDQFSTPYVKQYYNQFNSNLAVSNSAIDDSAYRNTLTNPNIQLSNNSNDDLINKMNHMIHLLEDQQSRKTEHVTEEIILYSFLGIFTIFVVDSFAKVGKYVR